MERGFLLSPCSSCGTAVANDEVVWIEGKPLHEACAPAVNIDPDGSEGPAEDAITRRCEDYRRENRRTHK